MWTVKICDRASGRGFTFKAPTWEMAKAMLYAYAGGNGRKVRDILSAGGVA